MEAVDVAAAQRSAGSINCVLMTVRLLLNYLISASAWNRDGISEISPSLDERGRRCWQHAERDGRVARQRAMLNGLVMTNTIDC